MVTAELMKLVASVDWWSSTINYEVINGNAVWRFGLVALVVLIAMAGGRIAQFAVTSYALRKEACRGNTIVTLLLKCISKPISVAAFALGLYLCKLCLVFEDLTATPPIEGISAVFGRGWSQIAKAVAAIAVPTQWLPGPPARLGISGEKLGMADPAAGVQQIGLDDQRQRGSGVDVAAFLEIAYRS